MNNLSNHVRAFTLDIMFRTRLRTQFADFILYEAIHLSLGDGIDRDKKDDIKARYY